MNMTRTQLACISLIASAFVLGALVLDRVADRLPQNQAQAEMVISKDNITKLTTQFEADSELVYVLDGRQELLLAYLVDPNRGILQLVGRLNLARVFERQVDDAGGQRGRTR